MLEVAGDREVYEPILQRLVGQVCHRTLACNSFKLRFETITKTADRGYIWIDPPWSLMYREQLITDSFLCPHYEEANYSQKFRQWCNLFSPLNQTVMTRYEFTDGGDLNLFFLHSYWLHIPAIAEELQDEDSDWYLHWYARIIKESS
ncbi:MAG: hypothetical protein J7647_29220 [Cyanobacteria bacterium SBLK]|nr:hypothetical protein [Cyanobacteria bacterium SBLK]